MSGQWLGIVVSGSGATFVHLDCNTSPPTLVNQFTWALQEGDRASAYATFYERVKDHINQSGISNVVIKGSAVGQAKATLSHLLAAELRGIVYAAAKAGGAEVFSLQIALVSRKFGTRKADAYVKDDTFWPGEIQGDLAKTRREAALLVLCQLGGC